MRGLVAIVIAASILAVGCGEVTETRGDEPAVSTTVAETTTDGPTSTGRPENAGRIRVTQHQTACCFMEGQISTAILRDAKGTEIVHNRFMSRGMIMPVYDRWVAAGTYEVESFQEPCDGNCGQLDAPTARCTESVNVAAGEEIFLTAAFAPGSACTITRTDAAPPSDVPDAFALREPYEDCGQSFGAMGTDGAASEPDPARTCFLDANDEGTTAEMAMWTEGEEGGGTGDPATVIARTNTDRTIELFILTYGTSAEPDEVRWQRATCPDLDLDSTVAFRFANCTEPTDIS